MKRRGGRLARALAPLRRQGRAVALPLGTGLADLLAAGGATLPDPGAATLPAIANARVVDFGGGNRLILCGDAAPDHAPRVSIDPQARGNLIVWARSTRQQAHVRFQGSANACIVADAEDRWPLDIDVRFSSDGGALVMGWNATANGTSIILEGDGRAVVIGDDAMFAAGSAIRTSDLHAIHDGESGALLNPSADVRLDAHVWVGEDALIGKGVRIAEGAVIGARALVTGPVAAHTIVGGVPARPLRDNIRWSRDRPGAKPAVR